jgi:molybdopterin-guanine dinucleotide biosynthesis protein A
MVGGGGERMTTNKVVITLNSQEIIRLTKILLDEAKEEAFTYLREVLKPQVEQATREQ